MRIWAHDQQRGLAPRRPAGDNTVVDMFEDQASRRRDEAAVLFRDRVLSYGELNSRANQLARLLIAAGVGPDRVVALCMARSADWIVAMLGVAKAGGAYLPIDIQYPPALITDLIDRGRAAVVIADDGCRDALQDVTAQVIRTVEWPQLLASHDTSNPARAVSPSNLVHLFFTSGSTGRPKAVATEHRNLSAYINGYHWMRCSATDTCLQFSSITFDPSAAEVWGPLSQGGRCAVYADRLNDLDQLAEWVRATRVTLGYFSSSVFNTLVDEAPDVLRPLGRVLIGGEALSLSHVRKALDLLPRTELINGYGPTEATIYYTGYRIPRPLDPTLTSVPIGRPLDNGCVYLVDQSGDLVPDGLPGEIWLGGDTLARGYFGEPALTDAAFPVVAMTDASTCRLYRTGDRGRWLPNGELEFLSRQDQQVKVRGVRIELGEIEAVLHEYAGVRHVVAVATPHPAAGNTLTVFVQFHDDVAATSAALRAFLAGRVRAEMVPARIEIRSELPLTPSGKIDRQRLKEWALAAPDQVAATPTRVDDGAPTAARTLADSDVEPRLAQVWKELLRQPDFNRDSNFFDLGGDSLLAVKLALQIERQFGVHLTLTSLVESGSLARMADLIQGTPNNRRSAETAPDHASGVPVMLCIGAGPFFRPFAEALAPRCRFQSVPTPTSGGESISSMEELAARVVRTIQSSRPQGPVIVAGWSLSGVVAVEVASQLERAGNELLRVILFDTLSPVRFRRWFASWPLIRQWQLDLIRARYHLEEALGLPPARAVRYLAGTLRDAYEHRHYDRRWRDAAVGRNAQADIPLDFEQAFGELAAYYSPAPLRARVLMVRPERHQSGRLFAGDLGWGELGYQVDLLTVPGDHERMFRPPNAAVLADRILDNLSS